MNTFFHSSFVLVHVKNGYESSEHFLCLVLNLHLKKIYYLLLITGQIKRKSNE